MIERQKLMKRDTRKTFDTLRDRTQLPYTFTCKTFRSGRREKHYECEEE